jgi:hypothetical protein
MSNVTIKSVVPAFDANATAIITAQRQADKVNVKAGAAIVQAMQQHLDACAVANVPRDLAGVNAIGKGIRECQAFLDAVAVGTFEKKTITEYAQGAMRAYFHNVEFTASLKNDPDFKIPAKDGSVKAGGSVTTTSREALFKTLNKVLFQCRTLGDHEAACAIMDTAQEYFADFQETAD